MFLPSSTPQSRQFSATTDGSSTTLVLTRSSSLMVFIFICHAPTLRHRTVRPSASFVPLTMLCAVFCSRHLFHPPSGSKPCKPPPTSSTSCPPRRFDHPPCTLPSSVLCLPTTTFASLVANVIPTCPPQPPTNSHLGLSCVFF